MSTHQKHPKEQAGMVLLEGLIAILIFSLGILAVVGMQGTAVKLTTDARYRSEACLLANQLLGTMWVSDRTAATLQTNFNSATNGAGYLAWLGDANTPGTVAGTLPGVVDVPTNQPTVNVDGAGIVTVTIKWLAPNEPPAAIPHQYVAIAQIR
jgi:type IV pilus assembly protein PilV